MRKVLIGSLLFASAVLGGLVGFFNTLPVPFNYLAGEIEIPLIALLIATAVLAALLTLVLCVARYLGLRSQIRLLRRQVRDSEAELKNLRNLPLQDG